MELFKVTIESKNPCYLHTLLIVAENEQLIRLWKST